VGIGRGDLSGEDITRSGGIIARYSDREGLEKVKIEYQRVGSEEKHTILVRPLEDREIQKWRI
jgi:hypothetical protein